MVLDPDHPVSCSVRLEGGTATFMAPELLVPSKFGANDSLPTTEADIYVFGIVIFQVHEQYFQKWEAKILILYPGPCRKGTIL